MGTNKELQLVERLLVDLTREDNPQRIKHALHDLFVRVNTTTGELSIYGDEDELLTSLTLFAWIKEGEPTAPTEEMLAVLREAVARLESRGYWEGELFARPFSVELVDDAFNTLEVLLYLDEELIQASRPLLEGLDEELNSFLGALLEDLK